MQRPDRSVVSNLIRFISNMHGLLESGVEGVSAFDDMARLVCQSDNHSYEAIFDIVSDVLCDDSFQLDSDVIERTSDDISKRLSRIFRVSVGPYLPVSQWPDQRVVATKMTLIARQYGLSDSEPLTAGICAYAVKLVLGSHDHSPKAIHRIVCDVFGDYDTSVHTELVKELACDVCSRLSEMFAYGETSSLRQPDRSAVANEIALIAERCGMLKSDQLVVEATDLVLESDDHSSWAIDEILGDVFNGYHISENTERIRRLALGISKGLSVLSPETARLSNQQETKSEDSAVTRVARKAISRLASKG